MLELKNLGKFYSDQKILENLNLSIEPGEIFCILGPSGAGKSTLLNIVAGIIDSYEGKVVNDAKRIGYVFQEDRLLPWMNVEDNIKIVNDALTSQEISHLLIEMELLKDKNKMPHELSGGMRQRVAIARAFAYKPDLLLLDEPFKSLDYSLKSKMIDALLRLWNETEITVLFVTHDMDEALWTADRIALLAKYPKGLLDIFSIENPRVLSSEDVIRHKNSIKTYWEESI
ncbi:MAG: ATP-binding cassette domain-containing protein [Bacillota bacterium]|nr:ATP-binding cassette domain-containing protein [Bacillota bacterium]